MILIMLSLPLNSHGKNFSSIRLTNNNFIKRPPLGLIPKQFYKSNSKENRFNDVCGAISRYLNEGINIPIEWIEEYNELIKIVNNG